MNLQGPSVRRPGRDMTRALSDAVESPAPLPAGRARRTMLIIKRSLQTRIVLLVLITVTLTAAIVGLSLAAAAARLAGRDLLAQPEARRLVGEIFKGLVWQFGLLCAVACGAAVFISHRIAGPLYRFEHWAATVAGGDLTTRIRLRPADDLKELALALNQTAGELHSRVRQDRAAAASLAARLTGLAQRLDAGANAPLEVLAVARELDGLRADLEKLTRDFVI